MSALDCANARNLLWQARRARLPAESQRPLEEHLKTCESCRREHDVERALDAALRKLPRYAAPPAVKENLSPPKPVAAKIERPQRGRRLRGVLLTGALALGLGRFGGIAWLHANRVGEELVNEAVNDHLRLLYAQNPLEIQSQALQQIRPWFEGRLDFAPVLDFGGNDEFALEGGSVAYFVDRKAAAFVFKRRLHAITVLVFRADGLPWAYTGDVRLGRVSASRAQLRGFNALFFRDGDLGYALVSDVAAPELERLAQKIITPR
jgi:anti-sigma factor RsiW